MSVCSYFPKRPALRLRGGDVPAREVEGQVLEGSFSVEDALAGAAAGFGGWERRTRAWRITIRSCGRLGGWMRRRGNYE
jgi:hypothetical protein